MPIRGQREHKNEQLWVRGSIMQRKAFVIEVVKMFSFANPIFYENLGKQKTMLQKTVAEFTPRCTSPDVDCLYRFLCGGDRG